MNATYTADVLAVSSGGGHWEQLLLICETFRDQNVFFVTTKPELLRQAGIAGGLVVEDCNRDQVLKSLRCVLQCIWIVLRKRPAVVLSTGAAPGLICMACARLIGARAIWIDSFANVEKLSLSGKLAKYIANVWLTQWEHLASDNGPRYEGQIL